MNNYHIYEAIGRGKHSTVYKGRKKKTIEYFAIKSVDKSQKAKVLQEVRILHSLDHPNVLKFYSWYETSAHLWLVLEYCVGGDLITLLRQDGHLPEESVHDLAADLVKALQYIHTQGIIYCDLKPSNILMDENGRTKLCDFGLARRRSDISRPPSASVPQGKRGTPCYMAPELFADGGIHSYASDFWALGCVLYESYAGRPPFTGGEFTQLVKSILTDPTPPLPGNPSRPFVNLIDSLLVKNPRERITWPELCGHAFWKSEFPLMPLPQPAFDSVMEVNCKPCLTECSGAEKTMKNRSPHKHQEKDGKSGSKRDENITKVPETPPKSAASARKTHSKASGKGLEEKPKGSANPTGAVNLLRLSRIAKSNLQRENEKENYRRCLPNGSEIDSEVKIENADMELNFDENVEEDAQEEQDRCDVPMSAPIAKASNNDNDEGKLEDMDIDVHVENVIISEVSSTDELIGVSPLNVVPATPCVDRPPIEERSKRNTGYAQESDSSKSLGDILQVIWHLSDSSVRPVMPNRKADKTSEQIPSLPFTVVQPTDLSRISKEQMELLINRALAVLSGNNNLGEKQNVIKYLEMLSSNPDAANMLINGPIMLILIKILRQSKVTVLRVQVAAFIGLLLRHCTLIGDDLSNSGLLGSLTDGLGDRQEKVRRFSMAALGELLYYISTQNEQNGDGEPPQPPSKDIQPTFVWQISNSVIQLVCSLLRKGEDDMAQLYALRTLENVCSQGGYWAARFTSQDVISNLCYIYRASGKPESMRLTAGSCLVRLVRFSPSSIQQVTSKISFKDLASSLVKGSPREQQICINLLIMSMLKSQATTNIGRQVFSSTEEKSLASCLVSLIEQGSEVLRGKALVLVAVICKSCKKWLLHFFCSTKLISVLDRLSKEKDSYVQRCLNNSIHLVASNTPNLLHTIVGDIQQLISGRRQGHHMSPLNSRAAQKTNIHLFPVILNLLRSSSFKQKMSINQLLQPLAKMIKLLENSFQGRDDCQLSVLRIVDSIMNDSSGVSQNQEIFVHEILPSLAALYKGNKDGDARFLCLKILFDVIVVILNEPSALKQRLDELKSISSSLFLPLYPTFIEDEDPIPMYAQKLLLMLMDFSLISIPDILQPTTVTQCFKFLHGDLTLANVNDVKLCVALASAPELDMKLLSRLKVVRRVGSLLEFVYIKGMEDFVEPTLGLCRALLLRSVCSNKDFIRTNKPNLLDDRSSPAVGSIKDITDLSVSVGIFLDLSVSPDANISDTASECVVLLLNAAPREGAAGLFGNLSKVSGVLGCWKRGGDGGASLPVQRMMHALGYSCRQYMSHGMILSVSMTEISKIEGILSEMKNWGDAALAQVATQVCAEMRRLPRNV